MMLLWGFAMLAGASLAVAYYLKMGIFKPTHKVCKYHFWRPGVKFNGNQKHLIKFCDRCQETVILTQEDFYSQFGYMPWDRGTQTPTEGL